MYSHHLPACDIDILLKAKSKFTGNIQRRGTFEKEIKQTYEITFVANRRVSHIQILFMLR